MRGLVGLVGLAVIAVTTRIPGCGIPEVSGAGQISGDSGFSCCWEIRNGFKVIGFE